MNNTQNISENEDAFYTDNMKNIYKIAFETFDSDKNDQITKHELIELLQSLGYDLTESQVEDMMFEAISKQKVKTDNYDTINFSQFQMMMNTWRKQRDVADEFLEAFRIFDYTGVGKVDKDVLEKILKFYAEDLSEEDIEYMLNDANVDGDGKIDYKQFVRLLLNK